MDTLGNSLCVKFVATVHPELQALAAFGNPSFMKDLALPCWLPEKMVLKHLTQAVDTSDVSTCCT